MAKSLKSLLNDRLRFHNHIDWILHLKNYMHNIPYFPSFLKKSLFLGRQKGIPFFLSPEEKVYTKGRSTGFVSTFDHLPIFLQWYSIIVHITVAGAAKAYLYSLLSITTPFCMYLIVYSLSSYVNLMNL